MILHKICVVTLVCLIVANSVASSTKYERKVDGIKPKKLSQNLKDHIEEILRATNAKPQGVKPELKQLLDPKTTVYENENNHLRTIINDLKPNPYMVSEMNQSINISKEAAGEVNSSGKTAKRESSSTEYLEKESKNYPLKPANLDHFHPNFGTIEVNGNVMPGVINEPNNKSGTSGFTGPQRELHSKDNNNPTNSGRVPQPENRPNLWTPSGHLNPPNRPSSNSKPTIGKSTTTMATTDISVFIKNATLKDKTEGKILVPDTNHNPDRVPSDNKGPHPTPDDGEWDNLFHHCLYSTDMSTVHCSGKLNKTEKVLKKQQIPKQVKTLRLEDFDILDVEPQVFTSSNNLNKITFKDIKELRLTRESLFFFSKSRKNMKVIISFHNCHFNQFPTEAITQNVDGRHENRNIFSEEKKRYLSVEFVNCTIGEMQSNSLHRALFYNFYMAKTKIKKMSSRAIDLDVKLLAKFEGNDIPDLPTEAICLHSNTVAFLSNRIHSLHNRSIVIEAKSTVSFNGNMFEELHAEALAGIEASSNIYGPSIVFTNNKMKRIGAKSFFFSSSFSASSQTILNNTFYIMCSCDIDKKLESFTGTTLHRSPSLKNVFRSSYCIENASASFMLVDEFFSEECSPFPIVTVSAVSVAGILLIIAVTVCVVCSLRVQQVKEEANMLGECTSQSFSTLSRNYTDTLGQPCNESVPASPFAVVPWGLAFPEVKTYQQNQLQEFTEQTESISDSARNSIMGRQSDPMTRNMDRASCPFN